MRVQKTNETLFKLGDCWIDKMRIYIDQMLMYVGRLHIKIYSYFRNVNGYYLRSMTLRLKLYLQKYFKYFKIMK